MLPFYPVLYVVYGDPEEIHLGRIEILQPT
jgi:hypothetical protein